MKKIVLLLQCIFSVSMITAGFPSGTLIKAKDSFIPIENIQKNDKILSPEYSYFFTEKPITYTQKRTLDALLKITIDKDNSFVCCKDTQFYIPKEQQWRKAEFLNIGDNILQQSTGRLKIKDMQQVNEATEVFDITIGNNNIFYVSQNAFLVNCLVQPPSIWSSLYTWVSNEGAKLFTESLGLFADTALKKVMGNNSRSTKKEFLRDTIEDFTDDLEHETNITNDSCQSSENKNSQALVLHKDARSQTIKPNTFTSKQLNNKSVIREENPKNFIIKTESDKFVVDYSVQEFKPSFFKHTRFSSSDSILEMNHCMAGAINSAVQAIITNLPYIGNLPIGGVTAEEVEELVNNFSFFNIQHVKESVTFQDDSIVFTDNHQLIDDIKGNSFNSPTENQSYNQSHQLTSKFVAQDGRRNVDTDGLQQNIESIFSNSQEQERTYFENSLYPKSNNKKINYKQVEKNLKQYSNIHPNIRYNPNKDYTNCRYKPDLKMIGDCIIDIDQMESNTEYEAARKHYIIHTEKLYTKEEAAEFLRKQMDITPPDNKPLSTPITPPDNKPISTPITPPEININITPITPKKPETESFPITKPEIGINITTIAEKSVNNESLPISQKNDEENKTHQAIEEFLETTKRGPKTGGNSVIHEKPGETEDVYIDFGKLNPPVIEDKKDGMKVGYFPDGTKIIARPNSGGGRGEDGKLKYDGPPTLEIQYPKNSKKNDIKVRYLRQNHHQQTNISEKNTNQSSAIKENINQSTTTNLNTTTETTTTTKTLSKSTITVKEKVTSHSMKQKLSAEELKNFNKLSNQIFIANLRNKKTKFMLINGELVEVSNGKLFDEFLKSKKVKLHGKEIELKNEQFIAKLKKEEDQKKSLHKTASKPQNSFNNSFGYTDMPNLNMKQSLDQGMKQDLSQKTPKPIPQKPNNNVTTKPTAKDTANIIFNSAQQTVEANARAQAYRIAAIYKYVDESYKINGSYLSKEHQQILDAVLELNSLKIDGEKKKQLERNLAMHLVYRSDTKDILENFNLSIDTRKLDVPLYGDLDCVNHIFQHIGERCRKYVNEKSKKNIEYAKNRVDYDYKKNGTYLSAPHKDILDTALTANKIILTQEQRKKIERQLAINLLVNPEYKNIYENTDFTLTRNNKNPNKHVVKNVNDVFNAIQQRLPDKYSNFLYTTQGKFKENFIERLRTSLSYNAATAIERELEQKEKNRRDTIIKQEQTLQEGLESEKKLKEEEEKKTYQLQQKAHYRESLLKYNINPDGNNKPVNFSQDETSQGKELQNQIQHEQEIYALQEKHTEFVNHRRELYRENDEYNKYKNNDDFGDWRIVKRSPEKHKEYYNKLKEIVEQRYKNTGSYLSKEHEEKFNRLFVRNGIRINGTTSSIKRVERQYAINILRYPYYLQGDWEKLFLDLNYDRNEWILINKQLLNKEFNKNYYEKLEKEHKYLKNYVKNIDELFALALKRSKESLEQKVKNNEISQQDAEVLRVAIEKTEKDPQYGFFEPIIIKTSPEFDAKYSTSYARMKESIQTSHEELKKRVEENFNKNGYYLNKEDLHALSNLILINKIQVSEKVFLELQKECAINLLKYPYYLKDDYEKLCIDLQYNRKQSSNPQEIVESKLYKYQPKNNDVIKNMDDLFISAFKRTKETIMRRIDNKTINDNDAEILITALEKAEKLNHFEPIIVHTSEAFDKVNSTDYQRKLKALQHNKKIEQQEKNKLVTTAQLKRLYALKNIKVTAYDFNQNQNAEIKLPTTSEEMSNNGESIDVLDLRENDNLYQKYLATLKYVTKQDRKNKFDKQAQQSELQYAAELLDNTTVNEEINSVLYKLITILSDEIINSQSVLNGSGGGGGCKCGCCCLDFKCKCNCGCGCREQRLKDAEEKQQNKNPHGIYEGAKYHHEKSVGNNKNGKSPAPKNGQAALDNSVEIAGTDRRVGVGEGQIVVLDKTSEGVYHGHVRTWEEICSEQKPKIKQALIDNGLVNKAGKILK